MNETTLRRWLMLGIVSLLVLAAADTASAGVCYSGDLGWFCL